MFQSVCEGRISGVDEEGEEEDEWGDKTKEIDFGTNSSPSTLGGSKRKGSLEEQQDEESEDKVKKSMDVDHDDGKSACFCETRMKEFIIQNGRLSGQRSRRRQLARRTRPLLALPLRLWPWTRAILGSRLLALLRPTRKTPGVRQRAGRACRPAARHPTAAGQTSASSTRPRPSLKWPIRSSWVRDRKQQK